MYQNQGTNSQSNSQYQLNNQLQGMSLQQQILQQKREYKDYGVICYFDTGFLQYYTRVTKDNAMEYFCNSPFYERDSNNERLRQQNLPLDKLKEFTGVEFAITHANDEQNVYLIEKRYRNSPIDTSTITAFYILNGTIFQAHTFKKIIDAKAQNAAFLLNQAFEHFKEHSEILYSNTHSWDHLNQQSKTTQKIDYDLIFENAQQEMELVYSNAYSKNKQGDSLQDQNKLWSDTLFNLEKNLL
eukprot:403375738